MQAHPTRSTLLERLRDGGDAAAWREFQRCYTELILRYCRARGLQTWDAEDACQDVLMGLVRSLADFRYDRARGTFRGYLHRAVQRVVIRHWERARRPGTASTELKPERLGGTGDPAADEVWEHEWRQHHLRRAMRALRRAVEPRSLEVFDGLLAGGRVEDVAREHGTSVASVHKVKQRIRDQLRLQIELQIASEDRG